MTLAVLRQQFSRNIEMRVFADAGEDIEHLSPERRGVLHTIRRQDRQSICARKIDKLTVHPFFAANEMALNFDVKILASERVDEKLGVVGDILGSARVSRAGDGVLAIANFLKRLFRRDAETSTRDACAPQSKERDQSFRELRQFVPANSAFSFFAAEMRLSQQFAKIF